METTATSTNDKIQHVETDHHANVKTHNVSNYLGQREHRNSSLPFPLMPSFSQEIQRNHDHPASSSTENYQLKTETMVNHDIQGDIMSPLSSSIKTSASTGDSQVMDKSMDMLKYTQLEGRRFVKITPTSDEYGLGMMAAVITRCFKEGRRWECEYRCDDGTVSTSSADAVKRLVRATLEDNRFERYAIRQQKIAAAKLAASKMPPNFNGGGLGNGLSGGGGGPAARGQEHGLQSSSSPRSPPPPPRSAGTESYEDAKYGSDSQSPSISWSSSHRVPTNVASATSGSARYESNNDYAVAGSSGTLFLAPRGDFAYNVLKLLYVSNGALKLRTDESQSQEPRPDSQQSEIEMEISKGKGTIILPMAPPIKACTSCRKHRGGVERCRVVRRHTSPNWDDADGSLGEIYLPDDVVALLAATSSQHMDLFDKSISGPSLSREQSDGEENGGIDGHTDDKDAMPSWGEDGHRMDGSGFGSGSGLGSNTHRARRVRNPNPRYQSDESGDLVLAFPLVGGGGQGQNRPRAPSGQTDEGWSGSSSTTPNTMDIESGTDHSGHPASFISTGVPSISNQTPFQDSYRDQGRPDEAMDQSHADEADMPVDVHQPKSRRDRPSSKADKDYTADDIADKHLLGEKMLNMLRAYPEGEITLADEPTRVQYARLHGWLQSITFDRPELLREGLGILSDQDKAELLGAIEAKIEQGRERGEDVSKAILQLEVDILRARELPHSQADDIAISSATSVDDVPQRGVLSMASMQFGFNGLYSSARTTCSSDMISSAAPGGGERSTNEAETGGDDIGAGVGEGAGTDGSSSDRLKVASVVAAVVDGVVTKHEEEEADRQAREMLSVSDAAMVVEGHFSVTQQGNGYSRHPSASATANVSASALPLLGAIFGLVDTRVRACSQLVQAEDIAEARAETEANKVEEFKHAHHVLESKAQELKKRHHSAEAEREKDARKAHDHVAALEKEEKELQERLKRLREEIVGVKRSVQEQKEISQFASLAEKAKILNVNKDIKKCESLLESSAQSKEILSKFKSYVGTFASNSARKSRSGSIAKSAVQTKKCQAAMEKIISWVQSSSATLSPALSPQRSVAFGRILYEGLRLSRQLLLRCVAQDHRSGLPRPRSSSKSGAERDALTVIEDYGDDLWVLMSQAQAIAYSTTTLTMPLPSTISLSAAHSSIDPSAGQEAHSQISTVPAPSARTTTLVLCDPRNLKHRVPKKFPERSLRIVKIMAKLAKARLRIKEVEKEKLDEHETADDDASVGKTRFDTAALTVVGSQDSALALERSVHFKNDTTNTGGLPVQAYSGVTTMEIASPLSLSPLKQEGESNVHLTEGDGYPSDEMASNIPELDLLCLCVDEKQLPQDFFWEALALVHADEYIEFLHRKCAESRFEAPQYKPLKDPAFEYEESDDLPFNLDATDVAFDDADIKAVMEEMGDSAPPSYLLGLAGSRRASRSQIKSYPWISGSGSGAGSGSGSGSASGHSQANSSGFSSLNRSGVAGGGGDSRRASQRSKEAEEEDVDEANEEEEEEDEEEAPLSKRRCERSSSIGNRLGIPKAAADSIMMLTVPRSDKLPLKEPMGSDRVWLYDTLRERRVGGNAAPFFRNLRECLSRNPHFVIYTGQDSKAETPQSHWNIVLWLQQALTAPKVEKAAEVDDDDDKEERDGDARNSSSRSNRAPSGGSGGGQQQAEGSSKPRAPSRRERDRERDRLRRQRDRERREAARAEGGVSNSHSHSSSNRSNRRSSGFSRNRRRNSSGERRLSLWNVIKKVRVSGGNAPFPKDAEAFLKDRPEYELYTGQDRDLEDGDDEEEEEEEEEEGDGEEGERGSGSEEDDRGEEASESEGEENVNATGGEGGESRDSKMGEAGDIKVEAAAQVGDISAAQNGIQMDVLPTDDVSSSVPNQSVMGIVPHLPTSTSTSISPPTKKVKSEQEQSETDGALEINTVPTPAPSAYTTLVDNFPALEVAVTPAAAVVVEPLLSAAETPSPRGEKRKSSSALSAPDVSNSAIAIGDPSSHVVKGEVEEPILPKPCMDLGVGVAEDVAGTAVGVEEQAGLDQSGVEKTEKTSSSIASDVSTLFDYSDEEDEWRANERVSVWNRVRKCRVVGFNAPIHKDLKEFLSKKLDYELYMGQDLTPDERVKYMKKLEAAKQKAANKRRAKAAALAAGTAGSTSASANGSAAKKESRGRRISDGYGNSLSPRSEDQPLNPVPLWNTRRKTCLSGRNMPGRRDLKFFLSRHPEYEVYTGQDLHQEEEDLRRVLALSVLGTDAPQLSYAQDRIPVWDRVAKKKVENTDAPMRCQLVDFIVENPSFDIYINQIDEMSSDESDSDGSDSMDDVETEENKRRRADDDDGESVTIASPSTVRKRRQSASAVSSLKKGNNVAIWDKVRKIKVVGSSAPIRQNLEKFLELNPDYEVWNGQEKLLHGTSTGTESSQEMDKVGNEWEAGSAGSVTESRVVGPQGEIHAQVGDDVVLEDPGLVQAATGGDAAVSMMGGVGGGDDEGISDEIPLLVVPFEEHLKALGSLRIPPVTGTVTYADVHASSSDEPLQPAVEAEIAGFLSTAASFVKEEGETEVGASKKRPRESRAPTASFGTDAGAGAGDTIYEVSYTDSMQPRNETEAAPRLDTVDAIAMAIEPQDAAADNESQVGVVINEIKEERLGETIRGPSAPQQQSEHSQPLGILPEGEKLAAVTPTTAQSVIDTLGPNEVLVMSSKAKRRRDADAAAAGSGAALSGSGERVSSNEGPEASQGAVRGDLPLLTTTDATAGTPDRSTPSSRSDRRSAVRLTVDLGLPSHLFPPAAPTPLVAPVPTPVHLGGDFVNTCGEGVVVTGFGWWADLESGGSDTYVSPLSMEAAIAAAAVVCAGVDAVCSGEASGYDMLPCDEEDVAPFAGAPAPVVPPVPIVSPRPPSEPTKAVSSTLDDGDAFFDNEGGTIPADVTNACSMMLDTIENAFANAASSSVPSAVQGGEGNVGLGENSTAISIQATSGVGGGGSTSLLNIPAIWPHDVAWPAAYVLDPVWRVEHQPERKEWDTNRLLAHPGYPTDWPKGFEWPSQLVAKKSVIDVHETMTMTTASTAAATVTAMIGFGDEEGPVVRQSEVDSQSMDIVDCEAAVGDEGHGDQEGEDDVRDEEDDGDGDGDGDGYGDGDGASYGHSNSSWPDLLPAPRDRTNLSAIELQREETWDVQFEALVEFGREKGHCNVPFSYITTLADGRHARIGRWLREQKKRWRKCNLAPERAARIRALVEAGQLPWELPSDSALQRATSKQSKRKEIKALVDSDDEADDDDNGGRVGLVVSSSRALISSSRLAKSSGVGGGSGSIGGSANNNSSLVPSQQKNRPLLKVHSGADGGEFMRVNFSFADYVKAGAFDFDPIPRDGVVVEEIVGENSLIATANPAAHIILQDGGPSALEENQSPASEAPSLVAAAVVPAPAAAPSSSSSASSKETKTITKVGGVKNVFCCIRPPGHHAGRFGSTRGCSQNGFCLLNNVAIGAYYARIKYALRRVAVIDIDAHFGNGTAEIFEGDENAFYASVHLQNDGPGEAFFPSSPCFCLGPDTDEPNRVLVNIYPPVRAGNPLARQKKPRGRQGFRNAFSESVLPRLRAFKPDIVFVSAGFDGAYSDPIGGQLGLRPTDFHWMTRMLQEVADEMSNGRLVSVLEGGYDISKAADGLASCAEAHVMALAGRDLD